MSDIRFACPFCTQHIACDRSYSGNPIDCPSCGARITVPKAIEVVSERTPIPVALPTPRERDLGMWTDEAWREHVRKTPDVYELDNSPWTRPQVPALLAAVVPVLLVFGARPSTLWGAAAVGALITGWLAQRQFNVAHSTFWAVGLFVGGVFYYAMLASVMFVGGCCWVALPGI
jgi:hypothetical protein